MRKAVGPTRVAGCATVTPVLTQSAFSWKGDARGAQKPDPQMTQMNADQD